MLKIRIIKILVLFVFMIFSQNAYSISMKLKSPEFKSGRSLAQSHIFNSFGCKGENRSPELLISRVPSNAKSLAITMYDPDAPTQSGWWHWIVYDIDSTTQTIESGSQKVSKEAKYGKNDYGFYGYGGPCPPIGTKHRYIFTLFALDIEKLDIPYDSSAAAISYYLNKHTIKKAATSGFYHRKN